MNGCVKQREIERDSDRERQRDRERVRENISYLPKFHGNPSHPLETMKRILNDSNFNIDSDPTWPDDGFCT